MLASDPKGIYGTADRAFRMLVERFGDGAVRALLARLGEGRAFAPAFRDATGVTVAEFEAELVRTLSALAVRD